MHQTSTLWRHRKQLTIVLVENSVDERVAATGHVHHQLGGRVDVDECRSVGGARRGAVWRVFLVRHE